MFTAFGTQGVGLANRVTAGRPVAPHENRCVASLRSVFKVYGAENALETGANVHRAGRPSR
jgi:hypothetical protein